MRGDLTGGSHSPSPTAQRPVYPGGARQRTSNSVSSSFGGGGGQNIPKSPNLAATNPLLLARLSSSAPGPSIIGGNVAPGESSAWQRREPRNRLFSTSSLVEEVHGSASSISTGMDNYRNICLCQRLRMSRHPLTCPVFDSKLMLCYFCRNQVGILSPGSFDFSHDEGFDSEDDSDHYEDFDDSDSGIHW